MSQENVEVVQSIWRSFMGGDFSHEDFTDDVEWRTAPDLPESAPDAAPIRGAAEIRQMLAGGWETVEEPWIEVDEFLDRGDQVVVVWRGGGVGRVGRVPVEWRETHVYTLRDGKVCQVREFRTRAEALAAVGPPQ
jgi:ketosteroid isomerase-like protein